MHVPVDEVLVEFNEKDGPRYCNGTWDDGLLIHKHPSDVVLEIRENLIQNEIIRILEKVYVRGDAQPSEDFKFQQCLRDEKI